MTQVDLGLLDTLDSDALHSDCPKKWVQYSWILPKERACGLADILLECSTFEKDDFLWRVEFMDYDNGGINDSIIQQFGAPEVNIISDQDWVGAYQNALPPLEVGSFYIHSSCYPPSETHPHCLQIDAAMAFGSGHHETTHGCMMAIQDLYGQGGWQAALDWGCGSGILTLVMNKLLEGKAMGMDNDPECILQAQKNGEINKTPTHFFVGEHIKDAHAALPDVHKFDCIIANLFSALLITLSPEMSQAHNLILSGMMAHQSESVLEKYAGLGWHLHKMYPLAQWRTLWLKKRD